MTTTNPTEEVAMSLHPQIAALRPEWVAENSARPERILSALGHPGYGRKFARRALDLMVETGISAHEAVYGRRGAL